MKWNSIRTKVLVALGICLIVGSGGIMALMGYSFEHNARVLTAEAVSGAQRLFTILETREIGKMTAVSATLVMNPQVRDAFAAKDRGRLLELTAPLYPTLKGQGITNWMFHTPAPDMAVFLRLHNPAKFGDHLNRFMDKEVVRTQAIVTGNELARAGFAVRILQPFPDPQGGVAGYVELGEELGQFIHTMKSQTGNDFGLLLSKKYVDRQFWADSSAAWKRRDNWNDNASFVVADRTTASDSIFRFDGNLDSLPAGGKVLERFKEGHSVFVRGIFPIQDAAGNTVGAMFVVHDISDFYLAMTRTQIFLVSLTVASLALGTVFVLLLLGRLVFRRLDRIVVVATNVVGGDYESEIKVSSDDEIGQFELLFEQFRCVFVDVLKQASQLQEQHVIALEAPDAVKTEDHPI